MELGHHVTLIKDATAAFDKKGMNAAHAVKGPRARCSEHCGAAAQIALSAGSPRQYPIGDAATIPNATCVATVIQSRAASNHGKTLVKPYMLTVYTIKPKAVPHDRGRESAQAL